MIMVVGLLIKLILIKYVGDIMFRNILLIFLLIWFLGTITFGMYFLLENHQYNTCERLIHTKETMCNRLGGVLDVESDGSTICLLTRSTIPP